MRLVLTCEHGGNSVPAAYARLFRSAAARVALAGHRGYDLGALVLARALARHCAAPLIAATVTRLLVDLNKSLGHPALFSDYSRSLDTESRQRILLRHYHPHRDRVTRTIEDAAEREGRVLHIAVHSFTPRLGKAVRRADIGLLYDPARRREHALCARWSALLGRLDPALKVRRNYPYLGKADGLTTALRRIFRPDQYLGIELEVNQASLGSAGAVRAALIRIICASVAALLAHGSPPRAGS